MQLLAGGLPGDPLHENEAAVGRDGVQWGWKLLSPPWRPLRSRGRG